MLSPGWTDYRKRVHYFGYDVTSQLKSGDNVLGAILGDGWYAGFLAFSGRRHYYGDKTRFIAQLRLDFADGTSRIIGTDGSWKAAYGPVREGDMLMGCVYDARLEMPGWSRPGFDDSGWERVTPAGGPPSLGFGAALSYVDPPAIGPRFDGLYGEAHRGLTTTSLGVRPCS